MIQGLSHMTFVVADIDRMSEIMTGLLGAKPLYDSGDDTFSISRERFFDLAGLWIAIMEGEDVQSVAAEQPEALRYLVDLVEIEREVEDIVLELVLHGLRAAVPDLAREQV